MFLSVLAIAITLINIWFMTVVIGAGKRSSSRVDSFALPDQGVSLWSFILLLFTGSTSVSSSAVLFSQSPEVTPCE